MSGPVAIGQAAKETGVKVPTIRFYESIKLLQPPVRTDGNRRQYEPADLRRLSFIRHARELGFDLDAIRALLALQDDPNQPCTVADGIAKARLADVERRIHSLTALKKELMVMIDGCSRGCVSDCRVIETLADHSLCVDEHSLGS
jgi:DNA-binding transcriptional MerR regulator